MYKNPDLILLRGPGGIGKSTVGDQLAERFSGYHIDVDELKPKGDYSVAEGRRIGWEKAFSELENSLDRRNLTVITQSFMDDNDLDNVTSRGIAKGYDPSVFFITGELTDCLDRNDSRSKVLSHDHITQRYLDCRPRLGEKIVSNSGSLDDTIGNIVSYLGYPSVVSNELYIPEIAFERRLSR